MANVFHSLSCLATAFHGLVAALAPRATGATGAARMPPAGPARAEPPKPLRVVRVLEPSAPRQVAGRMVISGRLADVCAELDRLAALEAA